MFLFSSIIITKLVVIITNNPLKKLFWLPVSEVGKFHRLTLNFRGWSFRGWPLNFGGWTVTKYFGSKSGNSNGKIYRKQIDKRYSTTRWTAFCHQPLLSYGSFSRTSSTAFWIKRKHKHQVLNNFLSKNKFPQSPKRTKK